MKRQISSAIFLWMFLILGGGAVAQDVYVDGADPSCGGNSPCYSTIAAALAAVTADGETISVAAGTYEENIVIDHAVNLIGAGAGVTTLESGNSAFDYLILLGDNVPITFTQGMVIEGFTLTGGTATLSGDNDLIMYRARVADGDGAIIIRNNIFDCDNDHSLKGIESRSGGNLTNARIENNVFKNECSYPMFLNSAIDWLIQGNDFQSSWTSSLQINTSDTDQTHDIDILNNTFTDSSLRTDIGDYTGAEQYFAAIGLASTVYNVDISGNTIQNGGNYSIAIGNRGATDLAGISIHCNNIISSRLGTLQELPVNILDAKNNWLSYI